MFDRLIPLAASYLKDPGHWLANVRWRIPKTVSQRRLVFVVGAPRSGTTLLQKVLEMHDALFSIEGETGLFSYQNIFDPEKRHFFLPQPEVSELLRESRDIVDFFEKGVERLTDSHKGKIFIEKTPQHVMYLPFLIKHFPQARFVHIVRDGRDAFCSARGHPGVPQGRSVKTYAKYWKRCVTPPLMVGEHPQVHTLKYEAFCSEPSRHLSDVMSFLDLQLQEQQLQPQRYGDDHRAGLEQFERLKKPITPERVCRWKQDMTEEEQRTFLTIAETELRAYGYEV